MQIVSRGHANGLRVGSYRGTTSSNAAYTSKPLYLVSKPASDLTAFFVVIKSAKLDRSASTG
jgi:hypothetical protein